ncbi:DoxX family protein [Halogeometricum limi]|uniref:Uncharacterized membrane protein YphA, DoxX/SURF4 family n=1 Tax=Halogeometricum limi TaxID=555875 RepID=A0A1I6GJ54_9EURY|nr:DoxX family protein [Halogeometricum limi]SFR42232.1 Uncharacterized membrane protein YphA, DoxX/SURF4 family [Halogeometricum limi]
MIPTFGPILLQFEGPGAELAFLAGRLAFGLVVAFMGLNHLLNVDDMAGYGQAKGLPAARFMVVASGVTLVLGGLGVATGVFPTLAAGAVAAFLVVATPTFHDFWAVPEDRKQAEMTDFLKNVTMLGAALVFLALSNTAWPYALGIGL